MEPWSELGIAATPDPGAIRRAYAARLKQCRPDDDPEGFARLRAAYQAALALAGRAEPAVATVAAAEPAISAPPPPEPPEPLAPEALAAARAIVGALDRREVAAAADDLTRALKAGLMPLALEMELADRLLLALVGLPGLSAPLLEDIGRRFGWLTADHQGPDGRGRAVEALQRRIAAERWLARLRANAASPGLYLGGEVAAAAHLLLGRGPVILSRVMPPHGLRRLLAELQAHFRWIGPNFDRERLAIVDRLAERPYPGVPLRAMSIGLWLLGLGWLIAATHLFTGPVLVAMLGTWRASRRALLGAVAASLLGMTLFCLPWTPIGDLPWSASFAPAVRVERAETVAIPLGDPGGGRLGPPPEWRGQMRLRYDDPPGPAEGTPDWLDAQRRLAAKGDTAAAVKLAAALIDASRGKAADAEAARWLRTALPASTDAILLLARLYSDGRLPLTDPGAVRNLYETAAATGDPAGELALARALAAGLGGPAEPARALALYVTAARAGSVEAAADVGECYLGAAGVARDIARSVAWLAAAAEAGDPGAMQQLGMLALGGQGVATDPGAAYRWLGLAVRHYREGDARLAGAKASLARAAARLRAADRSRIEAELTGWQPGPLRLPPETR